MLFFSMYIFSVYTPFLMKMVLGVEEESGLIDFNKIAEIAKKEQPKPQIVAAACGQCQFGMKGNGCELAVCIDGKNYFVDGTGIDDHGDAHDDAGFCNAISKAKVQGKVVDDKFLVTYFELVKKVK